jgi:hypothetical protein
MILVPAMNSNGAPVGVVVVDVRVVPAGVDVRQRAAPEDPTGRTAGAVDGGVSAGGAQSLQHRVAGGFGTADRTLWFTTHDDEWTARHIAADPEVSVTVPIPKLVLFVPWIKVPAATITFSGIAQIVPAAAMPDEARAALTKGLKFSDGSRGALIGIGVRPIGDFDTYG